MDSQQYRLWTPLPSLEDLMLSRMRPLMQHSHIINIGV